MSIAVDPDTAKIDALLEEWEQSRERGENPTAEDLCRDTPNLLDQVRQKLAALSAFNSLHGMLGRSTFQADVSKPTRPPPVVPGYEIFDELGRGGMGVVYRARQQALNRTVALKMILAGDFAGAGTRERFQREAEAVARLQHPNIVQVHELGDVNGQPFAALEFVAGGTLTLRLNRRPIPPQEAAILIETLARAVFHAHQHGVVHRDLKPGNVLLADDATLSAPKIADFGLAKLIDGTGGNQTKSGEIFGTPGYMAPEQAYGDPAAIGPGCDIYALGAILYECLTGRPPFEGDNLLDLLTQIGAAEPVAPRSLLPTTPRDIETICLKCLEKSPANRYATASDLADDLARFRRGEPVLARPLSRAGRMVRWSKRNPTVAVLTALATLGLVATATISTAFAVQSTRSADRLRGALDASQVRLAESHASRGRALAESGDVDLGLLWYARALQVLPAGHPELEADWREEFSGWEQNQRPLLAIHDHDDVPTSVLANPHSERLLVVGSEHVKLWGLKTRTLIGELRHGPFVYDAKFSPDGQRIALAGDSEQKALVSFWDAKTGSALGGLKNDPQNRVIALDWSPNGKFIATGLFNPVAGVRSLAVWDVATGESVGPPVVVEGDFATIRFSPESDRVYAFLNLGYGFTGGEIVEIDPKPGKPVGKPIIVPPRGPGMSVPHALALSRDGRSAWTVNSYRARQWDLAKRTLIDGLPLTQPIPAIAFPTSGSAAWVSEGATARQYSLTTGTPHGTKVRHGATITSIAKHEDEFLLTAAQDRTVRVWGALPAHTVTHPGVIRHVATSPDGRSAVSSGGSGPAALWDLTTDPPSTRNMDLEQALLSGRFSPDGSRFVGVAGEGGKFLYQWRTSESSPVVPPTNLGGFIGAVRFALSSSRFVTTTGATTQENPVTRMQLWDAESGQTVGSSFDTDPGYFLATGFAAGGTRLLVLIRAVNNGGFLCGEWDPATGERIGPTYRIGFVSNLIIDRVVMHPQGDWIAGPAPGSGILVWDRETKTERTMTGAFADPVTAISVSSDGKFVFAGSTDGWFGVYEAASGKVVIRGRGHARGVRAGLFPAGQNRLITTSDDGTVRQWNLETGASVGAPFLHPDGVFNAALTPNGSHLLTGCQDGQARLWKRSTSVVDTPNELQKRTEKRIGFAMDNTGTVRALTSGEWKAIP